MMAEWKKLTIGDLCDTISDTYRRKDEEVILVNTSDVLEGKILNHKCVENKNLKGQFKKTFKKDDILYSEIRPANKRYAYVDFEETERYIASTKLMVLRPKTDVVFPRFLFAFLSSNRVLAELQHLAETRSGTFPQITFSSELAPMLIAVPDFETQEKIVGVLSSIEGRIKNNNAINENLEQQALALFRQYFVDFAPYGGFAPSDWTEVSLDDVCTRITDGSHYSPADAPESPYPMYSVKDMETYGFNSSSCKHITEEDFRKMQKGDCVPLLNDILVAKDGSYLKEIFICSEEKDEAILSSIAIFRPDTNIIMPEILLYLLKQPSVRKDVGDNYVSGSALPRIVLKDFKKYRFMLPPMDEQAKIGSVLHSIRMQTKANVDEIQRLSSLRDTLLPRLMSGELDVSDLAL